MSGKPHVAAIEGWHTMADKPHLIGSQCTHCDTYFFPPQDQYCRNPGCDRPATVTVRVRRADNNQPPQTGTTLVVSTSLGEFSAIGSGSRSVTAEADDEQRLLKLTMRWASGDQNFLKCIRFSSVAVYPAQHLQVILCVKGRADK